MKKYVLWLALILCLLFSGCTFIEDALEDKMLANSGIDENENYHRYREYIEAGELSQQGYHLGGALDTEAEALEDVASADAIHMTFAENSYLDISYFSDSGKTIPLNTGTCYLSPGNRIYATVTVGKNIASSMYVFSGFRVYLYEAGRRWLIDTIPPGEDGLILELTSNYAGSEMSIEPIGKYKAQVISLQDYYTDDNGKACALSGTWTINDRQQTDDRVELSPVASYIISYTYNSGEYFYVSSTPQCFYSNNDDGIVIFERRDPIDETVNYSVELHKYVSISIETTQKRKITLQDDKPQVLNTGSMLPLHQLKYGDSVTIVTDSEWPEVESCRELVLQSQEELADGQVKYTLIVPQKGSEFEFDPAEYTFEHGTIVFKCFGEVVTSPQYLAPGSRISYEQGSAEEGYWLAEGEHIVVVGDEEETKRQLNSIRFVPKIKAIVTLEQPEFGGRIRYFADGKEILDATYQTISGTQIIMQFSPWEGWINHYKNGEVYTVTEDPRQTATIWGNDVKASFTEDEGHKPTLEVVLGKSIGADMQFIFSAPGLNESEYHYESRWFSSNCTIIEGHKIGTEAGIVFSMGGRAIQSGTAIKILIEKVSSDNDKTVDYRLVNDLTEHQAPILVYEKNELGTSPIWYKSIKITISVVDVMTFSPPAAPGNASITVRNVTTRQTLKSGDILEGAESVTVTITPSNGYYVSGKDVKNDTYQSTMKFSKYCADIQTIVTEHPIEQYYQITLNSDDPYGTCIYKLDGELVSGPILVKDGQKLTLEYEITAPGYVIDGAKGIVFGLGKNDQKKADTVVVSEHMNGQIISRDMFDIVVVKGG